MTIRNYEQAAVVAEHTFTNHVGWCQLVTRGYYEAPSVGDLDGDGAADAEDGAKSEPIRFRHSDRTGRRGAPASFFGGSDDNGHRAIFIHPGIIRSTDFNGHTKRYQPGVVGNGTVSEIEAAMGVTYAFWSETISGQKIPKPRVLTRGWRVNRAQRLIEHANRKPNTRRAGLLKRIASLLAKIPGA